MPHSRSHGRRPTDHTLIVTDHYGNTIRSTGIYFMRVDEYKTEVQVMNVTGLAVLCPTTMWPKLCDVARG